MPRPRPHSTAKQGVLGAEPPREAVRVVDNVRTTRPDLLVRSPLTGARGGAHAYRSPSPSA
jgi:hypothetical protein